MSENTLIRLLDAAKSPAEQVIVLRNARWTYEQIRQGLGCSKWLIAKAVKDQKVAA